jgi:hypothetical protein
MVKVGEASSPDSIQRCNSKDELQLASVLVMSCNDEVGEEWMNLEEPRKYLEHPFFWPGSGPGRANPEGTT